MTTYLILCGLMTQLNDGLEYISVQLFNITPYAE
jgi:hypothetical protein